MVNYKGILSLCKLEMEYIEKEEGADHSLLKIRMDTIYVNLCILQRSGYTSQKEKDQYKTLLSAFIALQKKHSMFYDNDDL